MSISNRRRYPGVKPFNTAEHALFFGRNPDIDNLLDLIWLEKLLVLFGKSGYGKSSLINAGILPALGSKMVPVIARFNNYTIGQTLSPLDILRQNINATLAANPSAIFLDTLNLPQTLWLDIKRKQSNGLYQFLLIFDQFEEFFTYPLAQQRIFKEHLAELLYTEVPQILRDYTDLLESNQQAFIATPFNVKVLLVIRSDRVSLLDSMKDHLPNILVKRYELKGLSKARAREAIEQPALLPGKFASPLFTYSSEALELILDKLTETQSMDWDSGIETFQLQILCEYLEEMTITESIPNNHIEPAHFAHQIDRIFGSYYQRLLGRLAPNDRKAARILIEEKMIFVDDMSGEARRLSNDSGVLLRETGVTKTLLDQLEAAFLLRRDISSTGGFNYEISHDSLIPVILNYRKERREAEYLEQKYLKVKSSRKRNFTLLTISGLIATLATLLALYILKLNTVNKQQAHTAYADALAYKSLTALREGDLNAAFRLAEFAHRYVESNNPNVVNALIKAFYYNDYSDSTHYRLPSSTSLEGHSSWITSVSFSQNGKMIATGSRDKTARIWSASSKTVIHTLTDHSSSISSLAFSPDGKMLATGSSDGAINVWNTLTGSNISSAIMHSGAINSLSFSPDGRTLVTGSSDQKLKIWDVLSQMEIDSFENNSGIIRSLAFSPDGKAISLGTSEGIVNVWHFKNKQIIRAFERSNAEVLSLSFSPNGDNLAIGLDDGTTKIWDSQQRKVIRSFDDHTSGVSGVAFSPDGKMLVTASFDKTAKLRHITDGKIAQVLKGHFDGISSISFSPNGKTIVTGSRDRTARIWYLHPQKTANTFIGHTGDVLDVSFSPNGRTIATASADSTAKIWALSPLIDIQTLIGHSGRIETIAFSPNGNVVATGSQDATIKLWNTLNGALLQTLTVHKGSILSLTFSPDGKLLASGSADKTIELWRLESMSKASGRLFAATKSSTFIGHDANVRSVSFSPDSKIIASSSDDKTIKLWDVATGQNFSTLTGHASSVLSVSFSPSGKWLVSGSYDKTAKIWDVRAQKSIQTLRNSVGWVGNVAFSPSGNILATTDAEGNGINIWDAETGKIITDIKGYHKNEALALSFSPNGSLLATGSKDWSVKLWNINPDSLIKIWSIIDRTSSLILPQLEQYGLENLLSQQPQNENKLIGTKEVWQIKAFADIYANQASGSSMLTNVNELYARSERLYIAALELQDEPLIRTDYSKMLRQWALVYQSNNQPFKFQALIAKADKIRSQ